MATKIVTKNSSTASAVPTASDLVQGELAVNVADKRLFTEDNGGSIVELGTNPSTIDINAGTIDGTAIGASSASTGAFTTLTATGLTVDTDTLYVDSTNNRVGIGTTSPAESIHTAGNIRLGDSAPAELYTNSSELRFGVDKNNDNGTSNITFYVDNSEKVRIDSSGKVGIGTTSPSEKLEIQEGSISIKSSTISQETPFYFMRDDSGQTADYVASIGMQAASSSDWRGVITFNAKSGSAYNNTTIAERMRIDSSGNVGIGTTAIMQDFGGGRTTLALKGAGSTDYSTLQLGNYGTSSNGQIHGLINFYDGTTSVSRIQSVRASNTSDAHLAFYTAPSSGGITERLRIDSSGNLLVGTTSSSSSGTGRITAKGLANGSIFTIISDQSAYGSGTLGHIRFLNSNGAVGQISTSGSSTAYNTSSDYRLKENVVELTGATERLKQLNPSRFNFIADADTTVDGFLAHEVADVVPEAISGEKDAVDADGNPEYQGIDQSKLVPLLVATIQELEARITQLENN